MTKTFDVEAAYEDLYRSHEMCLHNHTALAIQKTLCDWRGGKDHVWLVRQNATPATSQKCCCGQITA